MASLHPLALASISTSASRSAGPASVIEISVVSFHAPQSRFS
jgi:hypothetical protein